MWRSTALGVLYTPLEFGRSSHLMMSRYTRVVIGLSFQFFWHLLSAHKSTSQHTNVHLHSVSLCLRSFFFLPFLVTTSDYILYIWSLNERMRLRLKCTIAGLYIVMVQQLWWLLASGCQWMLITMSS